MRANVVTFEGEIDSLKRFKDDVNYCAVASGRADGIIAFTKDAFPEFAGSLIIKEAGGKFTNIEGSNNIAPTDRIFIGGNMESYKELFGLVRGLAEYN